MGDEGGVTLAVRHHKANTPPARREATAAPCTFMSSRTKRYTRHDPSKTSRVQDHGTGAAVMPRDSESDTSGAFARVLELHVPFVCACVAPNRSFARLSACLFWQITRACECVCCAVTGPLCACALHLLARALPVPVRVFCPEFGQRAKLQ